MTVTQILEEVKEEICDNYCKHLAAIQGAENPEEAFEKLMEDTCSHCPLDRL